MGLVVKAPNSCREEFGADLDGCSTQSNEGCGRCHLAIKYEENKYPDYIMKKIRQRMGLEEDDTSIDDSINKMSKDSVFDKVLGWEGFIGYTDTIKGWVEDIYNVELKVEEEE